MDRGRRAVAVGHKLRRERKPWRECCGQGVRVNFLNPVFPSFHPGLFQ